MAICELHPFRNGISANALNALPQLWKIKDLPQLWKAYSVLKAFNLSVIPKAKMGDFLYKRETIEKGRDSA